VSGRTRWAIGVAICLGAYAGGYLLSRAPATGHLGGAVAVVGMAVLSWLVPVLLRKRPTADERETDRERRRMERLEALTTGRPGYGRLRNLVVGVDADTSVFLWKLERDGVYDVVSYTEFLLRMKPGRGVA
jgi:uncharacterized membrane protein YfcA